MDLVEELRQPYQGARGSRRAAREAAADEIERLRRDKQLLVAAILDDALSRTAMQTVARAIRDGGLPLTDDVRAWIKARIG